MDTGHAMKGIEITCAFCGQQKRVPLSPEGVMSGMAAYIAHLIESHWDMLEHGRDQRADAGVPVNDAWTRI